MSRLTGFGCGLGVTLRLGVVLRVSVALRCGVVLRCGGVFGVLLTTLCGVSWGLVTVFGAGLVTVLSSDGFLTSSVTSSSSIS